MENKIEKVDRRVLYTKKALRESLLSLMKEKPITKITTTELCLRADINRNTFYTHFDSPESLLASIEDELYEQVKCSIDKLLKNGSISDLMAAICQSVFENYDLFLATFSKYGNKDFFRRMIDLAYERCIVEWRAAGVKGNEEQLHMLYNYMVCGCISVIEDWVQNGMKQSMQEIAVFIENANHFGFQAFLK